MRFEILLNLLTKTGMSKIGVTGAIIVAVLIGLVALGVAIRRKDIADKLSKGLLVFFGLSLGVFGAIGLIVNLTSASIPGQGVNTAGLVISTMMLIASGVMGYAFVRMEQAKQEAIRREQEEKERAERERLEAERLRQQEAERRALENAAARKEKIDMVKDGIAAVIQNGPQLVISTAGSGFSKIKSTLLRRS